MGQRHRASGKTVPLVVLVCFAHLAAGCGSEAPTEPVGGSVRGVVLMIGDGMGFQSLAAARSRVGALNVDAMGVPDSLLTFNAFGEVTDSGASATAMASGVLTYTGAIGVGSDSSVVKSVLEVVEESGGVTGLVSTSSVTDATPAAFAAHVLYRNWEYDIAAQEASSGVDILLGGGAQYFSPGLRPDGRDLLTQLRWSGTTLLDTAQDLLDLEGTGITRMAGFFAVDDMPKAYARSPGLEEMASAALGGILSSGRDFFLMVEGSQIDWAGHGNDIEWQIAEVLDLDRTIGRVLTMVEGLPGVTVVVTADHETGGLDVDLSQDPPVFTWSTTSHTGAKVPLYATGWGAAVVQQAKDVAGLGTALHQLLGVGG